MPLVIPPSFANCAVQLLSDSDPDPWYVTFGVDLTGQGGAIENVGEYILEQFGFGILTRLSNTVQIMGVEMTIGQDGADPVRRFIPSPTEVRGESPQEKLPQNCALLVKKVTALGGRRQQGRFFLPNCIDEGACSNTGVLTGTHRANHQASINDFLSGMNTPADPGDAVPLVLLHGSEGAGSTEPTPIVALTVDGIISTQRRRLR